MDHVINWIWQGVLIAGITTGVLRLMERTRAQARYVVCWLALAAIAALPVLPGGLPSTMWLPALAGRFGGATPEAAAAAPLVAPVAAMPSAWWTSADLALLAGGLWLLAAIGRLAADVRATRRSRAACRAFPADLESELRCWSAVREHGRRTALALSGDVRAASVIGGGRPIVAVAPALLSRLAPDQLDRAVIHEWAHVQRRDDLAAIAHAAVRVIAGWHPGVWWLERRMLIEREIACDETAVAVTGCPKRYAACLTAIAALPAAAMERAGAMGVLSTPALSRRVARILSRRATASRAGSAGAAAAAIVVLSALSLTLANHRLVTVIDAASQPESSVAASALASQTAATEQEASGSAASLAQPPTPFRLKAEATRGTLQAQATRRDLQAEGTPRRSRDVSEPPPVAAVDALLPLAPAVRSSATPAPLASGCVASAFGRKDNAGACLPEGGSHTIEALPASTLRTLPVIDRPAFPPAAATRPAGGTPPWIAVADAGAAVGHGSQTAGVAAAKFFTLVGKKIAGSF